MSTHQPLPPGTIAPDFRLPAGPDRMTSLSDFRGRPVVLVFYPADWSPVCGDQLALYNEVVDEFGRFDAQVLAISVDGVWCHRAFAEQRGITFPLLADFEPKGEVSRRYGAYRTDDGVSERALFVIDPDGEIVWQQIVAPEENPGADGILRALEGMTARQAS